MRVLIAGCGYVGMALARRLVAEGHSVVGLRRSAESDEELRSEGIEAFHADLADPSFRRPEGKFDWVVFCAATDRNSTADDYQALYVEGNRRLLASFEDLPPTRYVYTSSTSVYGQNDGSMVKESSPTNPESPTAQVLLMAEQVVLDAAKRSIPTVVLRLAGIYGKDRGHLFHQYLRNEARIPGSGHRHLNMIHQEDAAGAIAAAFRNGRPGEVYNVVDQEPVTQIHFFTWMSETLGKYLPPKGPEETDADRKRGLTNKKVSNRRLTMELGYALKYPTFRQGYTAEIKRMTDEGILDIKPEPR